MKHVTSRHTVITFAALAVAATTNAAVITAQVNGVQTDIGNLNVVTGVPHANSVNATFTFGNGFAYLDEWYDFRWVNIQTMYTLNGVPQPNDPILGNLPAIDPQPGPGEDNIPYYYNAGEWPNQHVEGVRSSWYDAPNDPQGVNSKIHFSSYLVVDNITDPAWAANTLCVIGSFSWEYDNLLGASFITAPERTAVAGDAMDINDALTNPPGHFAHWNATFNCNLVACVPTPGAATTMVLASTLCIRRRREARPSAA